MNESLSDKWAWINSYRFDTLAKAESYIIARFAHLEDTNKGDKESGDKSLVQGITDCESVKIGWCAIAILTRTGQTSRVRAQPFLAASSADILTRGQLFTLNVALARGHKRRMERSKSRKRNTNAKRSWW